MTVRGVIVSLALFCTFGFCAFAAPSAFAGTTAFTCAPAAIPGTGEFKDPHCDNEDPNGDYEHEEIEPGKTTAFTVSNKETKNNTTEHEPALFHVVLGGTEVTIECTEVHGEGWITNTPGPPMKVSGEGTITFSKCTVIKPLDAEGKPRCLVNQPISVPIKGNTYENASEMGAEYSPKEGTTFVSITLTENEKRKCTIKGTYKVEGSAQGTPGGTANGHGATMKFIAGMGNLTCGGNAASLTGTVTTKMETAGNAITLTTTAS